MFALEFFAMYRKFFPNYLQLKQGILHPLACVFVYILSDSVSFILINGPGIK